MANSKHKKTFYLITGETFSTLESFSKKLLKMSEDVYHHHVTPAKNDFANWVRNSLNDEKLADKIDGHLSKMETEIEVLRHLVHEKKNQSTNKKNNTSSSKTFSAKKSSSNSKSKTTSSKKKSNK